MMSLLKKNRQCFISHCSEDKLIMQQLGAVTNKLYSNTNIRFFNTFNMFSGTKAGDEREKAIRDALSTSDLMIAVITDNYLRSTICISEISTFWYTGKNVIPIIFSRSGRRFLLDLFGKDIIYIDASSDVKGEETLSKLSELTLETLKRYKFFCNCDDKTALSVLYGFYGASKQAKASRPYIGSLDDYEKILLYCNSYGISSINNSSIRPDYRNEMLSDKTDVYILSTTGASLIKSMSADFLPKLLAKGTNLTVLLPNQYSDFCRDVAEVEDPDNFDGNLKRIASEFTNVFYDLNSCIEKAERLTTGGCGKVYVGCAYTLLRQTITIGVNDRELWGWMSLTLPPKRTIDGTPTIEFRGGAEGQSMARLALEHILAIRKTAISRGDFFELSQSKRAFEGFYKEKLSAEQYWKQLYAKARENMLSRYGNSELIEVAAQHPLMKDGSPGPEFAERLKAGAALYREITQGGGSAQIYVPGSLHMYNGTVDARALCDAGKRYLLGLGIPEEDILGEKENTLYKKELGVYNSADECYVASEIFKNGGYGRLHCVCSPNQLMRKKLFYIAFGVIPFFHTVNCDRMFHDDVYEIFHTIPDVLYRDHTWQGETSKYGLQTRRERKPDQQKDQ